MKIEELTDHALDLEVAKCEGAGAALVTTHSRGEVLLLSDHTTDCDAGDHYKPSTNWAQAGPIIEREKIDVMWCADRWCSYAMTKQGQQIMSEGPTPLIAAMRCYVASKLQTQEKEND